MGSSPVPLSIVGEEKARGEEKGEEKGEDLVKGRLVAFKVKSVGSIPASSGF